MLIKACQPNARICDGFTSGNEARKRKLYEYTTSIEGAVYAVKARKDAAMLIYGINQHCPNRARGMVSLSDSEIYEAFDISYDYDIHAFFKGYLEGRVSLASYADKINAAEYLYPANYVKLRFLENHDQNRAAFMIPDAAQRRNWTAFLYFQKGASLIYAGQEFGAAHRPSLFDKDPIKKEADSACNDDSAYLASLYKIKKNPILAHSSYSVTAATNNIIVATHKAKDGVLIGVFSLKAENMPVRVDAADGIYTNLIDGTPFTIEGGYISCKGSPIIFAPEAGCQ